MSTTLTPQEHTIVVTARNNLDDEHLPWCEHWLFACIQNNERSNGLQVTSESVLGKALQSLVKKNLVKVVSLERYALNTEATVFVK